MSKDKKMKIEIEDLEYVMTQDLQVLATNLLAASAVYTGKQRGASVGEGVSPAEALGVATTVLVQVGQLAGEYFKEKD